MLRGPLHHDAQAETVRRHVAEFPEERFGAVALARAGGDASLARQQNLDALLNPTVVYTEMLERAPRVASILGHMRWQLLRLPVPLLAYSDHPVVVWPMRAARARPFARPQSGPLGAIEIRMPLSPDLALLLSWAPTPSPVAAMRAGRWHAADLNSFTISQADRQWMHRPGDEPPVAADDWPTPMTVAPLPGYGEAQAAGSWRRIRAVANYLRDRDAPPRSTIDVLDDLVDSTRTQGEAT